MASPEQADRLFDLDTIWRQVGRGGRPALNAFQNRHRQLNREDLLGWLHQRGALVGPVPGIATGPRWQPVTEHGATRWVWNSPGEATARLPRGLQRGRASGTATRYDAAEQRPVQKKICPAAAAERWNRSKSQSAISDWTTKPPPKESRLKSAAMM